MESLYRKYRPLTFDSVVGQQHIVSTLEHAVTEGRLSHAYLFCGPRGTGKTTMARILAKSLLCEHAEAARATGASGCMPDGDCPECQAIAEGTHPDVYELDAASRTGVDNVREEIVNSVSFAPVRGAYKVYIIDEVHMLTTAAFNALLKTLEEPPAHVVFVLCTTDPQKILETILSRCQRFDFHRISNDDLVGRMRYICEQEGFAFDDEALEIVAKHARGGMRDALSTLEQLSVFGDGAVRTADARALLGEVASSVLSEFSCKMAVRDTVGLFGLVRGQVDEGNDLLELTRDLVGHMRDVYTASIAGPKKELFDGTPEEIAGLVEEAKLFEGADRLARTLTVLDDAALEMRNASDPRLVLEIALTRLARPESDLTLEALAERIARLEAQLAAGVPSGPVGAERLVGHVAGAGAAAGSPVRSATPARPVAAAPVSAERKVSAAKTVEFPANSSHSQREGATGVPAAGAGVAVAETSGRAAAMPPQAPGQAAATMPGQSVSDGAVVSTTASTAAQPGATASTRSASAAAAMSAPVHEAAPTAVSTSVGQMPPTASNTSAVAPASPTGSGSMTSDPAPDNGSSAAEKAAPASAAASSSSSSSASDPGDLQRKWSEVVKRVVAAQPSRGALLQSSRAQTDDGSTLTVGFPAGSTFAIKMLGRPDSHALVAPIVDAVFGPRAVNYVMDGGAPSPASASAAASHGPAASASGSTASTSGPVAFASAAPQSSASPSPTVQRPSANSALTASANPSPATPASSVPVPSAPEAPASAAPTAERKVFAAKTANCPANSSHSAGRSGSANGNGAVATAAQQAPVPSVDQASGPTIVPEPDVDAQRKAWEDEQVPYDDAMIAAYTEDDDAPPFDIPGDAPVAIRSVPQAKTPQGASSSANAKPPFNSISPDAPDETPPWEAAAPASTAREGKAKASASVPPWEAAASAARASAPSGPKAPSDSPSDSPAKQPGPSGNNPFNHPAVASVVPQSEEEAKEMLGNIFGAGIVFKDA